MANYWLEPWDERGPALERRANTPEMHEYLGGVESDESIMDRHRRILEMTRKQTGAMFLIMTEDDPDPVGSVGYWEREWQGRLVFEMGWKILPAYQGRGFAAGAVLAVLGLAAAEDRHRWVHAYPRVDNTGSNSVCRRAGFELRGETDYEYPKGRTIRCNDWRFDLSGVGGPS
jgi:RimJ/RimL family protein N-acetyltransferase